MTEMLRKTDRIFVAGHRGLVGSALVDCLKKRGYHDIITRTRDELDLLNTEAVSRFYEEAKPDVVFVAAAKVGGIQANNIYRADFIYQNLQIQNNLIWGAHIANVRRLIFLGSSCVYPKEAPQPIPEEALLTSVLEYTNRPYAIAKIAGLELVHTLRLQYGRDYFSVMPTNLYGPRDNFDLENSHVLPALIRKCVEAHAENRSEIVVWGTGEPLREFMHARDCADSIVFLAEKLNDSVFESPKFKKAHYAHINSGTGQEIRIGQLAETIARLVGFKGTIRFDRTKPDGTMRKVVDSQVLASLGWKANISLEDGIRETIEWFKSVKWV
jgi:GDP-L-fucose synthase